MKYGVKLLADDSVQCETDDFEKARSHAVSLSNWNIECQVIDLETGEPLKHFTPYRNLFKKKLA